MYYQLQLCALFIYFTLHWYNRLLKISLDAELIAVIPGSALVILIHIKSLSSISEHNIVVK